MNSIIKVGAKVRLRGFEIGHYVEVLFIYEDVFFCKYIKNYDNELTSCKTIWEIDRDWLPYEEPKKKVMLYPALMKTSGSFPRYYMTDTLYEKELDDSVDTFVRLVKELGIEVEQ